MDNITAHFTHIDEAIHNQLDHATHTILIAVAWITDSSILEKLIQKAQLGINVELIVSANDEITTRNEYNVGLLEMLQIYSGGVFKAGAESFMSGGIMHNKFCIIDYTIVLTGSYNWTNQAKKNFENVVVIQDTHTAELFSYYFNIIKTSGEPFFTESVQDELTISFTASRSLVEGGDPFKLYWCVANTDYVEIDNGIGAGRFGPGLPRINDGSLLFLLHMISKMHPVDKGGSRIGIVLNGSPLFTGGAGSGESEIRKWIIENDMLEAIVALPDQLFYNTGISTYIWIVTNRKAPGRKGKVQMINAASFFHKMSRSLGNKRNEISQSQMQEITKLYGSFTENEYCKIYPNAFFGYSRITVEQPMRDEKGNPIPLKKSRQKSLFGEAAGAAYEADASLRDNENVPLQEDIEAYFKREVLPHIPDAWIDHSKTKVGYEVNFTKYFYQYKPLRKLEEIRADILALEQETDGLIKEVIEDEAV